LQNKMKKNVQKNLEQTAQRDRDRDIDNVRVKRHRSKAPKIEKGSRKQKARQ
jgi:hypothetical protein